MTIRHTTQANCAEPGCQAVAVVGWGRQPIWLCLEHFQARLRNAREIAEQAARDLVRKASGGAL